MREIMKNANIQTIEECYRRLLDGEVFYFNHSMILFDKKVGIITKEEEGKEFSDHVSSRWLRTYYREFETKSNWYENIKKPVPCWVGDTEEELKSHEKIDLIISYKSDCIYKFRADTEAYRLAEPILAKEIEECYEK